jgi:hypothetical protein
MPQAQIIIHERLGTWARQLRPRFAGWPVRWSESPSTASLIRVIGQSSCPILVLNLGDRPIRGLDDLDQAISLAPSALSVVLDPSNESEVALLARELGATLVLGGVVVPPTVEKLLQRWIPLAIQRNEREGWSPGRETDPDFPAHSPIFPLIHHD